MKKNLPRLFGVFLVYVIFINAQTTSTEKSQEPNGRPIKIEVDYVDVSVTVLDTFGRSVTGLSKENFKILEDNDEQKIDYLSTEDVPISIGFIVDVSGSMTDKLEKVFQSISLFMRMCSEKDEFFLISFSDRPKLEVEFTGNITKIQDAMKRLKGGGRTSLLDAIYLGLNQMQKNASRLQSTAGDVSLPQRHAIVIISDGGDNNSRYLQKDVKNILQEADTQLYAIGIFDPAGFRKTSEEVNGPALLEELAEMSGGHTIAVENLNDIQNATKKIARELRNQYIIMYRSKNHAHDGKWRKIKVKLNAPKNMPPLEVFAKSGYFAPQY